MAYSYNDLFRPLRLSMRINGLFVGLGCGVVCLLTPAPVLIQRELLAPGPVWPLRLAGALLLTLGLFWLLAAAERTIELSALAVSAAADGLIALVLLIAYAQGEFSALGTGGRIVLVLLVALTLTGAVLPLRYLRAEYQT